MAMTAARLAVRVRKQLMIRLLDILSLDLLALDLLAWVNLLRPRG